MELVVITALGFVILILAGDLVVRGAVNLALRLGVPALLVSLTIVAFGTSAPELLIAIKSVTEDVPGIAMGNVIGSNTANVLLVLGVPALISRLSTGDCNFKKSYFVMLAVTAVFMSLAMFGPFTFVDALILLAVLALVLGDQFREARAHLRAGDPVEEVEGADAGMNWWRIGIYLVLGLIGLPLGADLLVDGAVGLAQMFDVSDRVIGLTLIAIGTSLPELATTVAAAWRRQADVALGNVIGSNVFNLLAIIGVAALIGPIPVEAGFQRFDLWVMLGASLMLLPFVLGWRNLTRRFGVIFVGLYVAYLVVVIT